MFVNSLLVVHSFKMEVNNNDKRKSLTKTGELNLVITSIIPQTVTNDFTTVIKSGNDSTLENLLEFRSLMSDSFKTNVNVPADGDITEQKEKSYSSDVKDFIQKILERKETEKCDEENSSIEKDKSGSDSGCKSEQNDSSNSSHSASELVILKKQKIDESVDSPVAFATMASSTPIKMREHQKVNLDISGVGFLSFTADEKCQEKQKNSSLNDSDFESMDQDQYESIMNEKIMDKDATLINSAGSKNKSSDKENLTVSLISRTSSISDFKQNFKMIIEETVKRTPMAIRRAFNMDCDSGSNSGSSKPSKFMNLFSSTKKLKKKQNSLKKKRSKKSGSGLKRYPLTKENLKKYLLTEAVDKENVEWGENFDYSFLCEPASSDVDENENSNNYISYNTSLDSSIEMLKSPLVPHFRIDPPSELSSLSRTSSSSSFVNLRRDIYHPACDYVNHTIKCSYASKIAISTTLRRSISDPMNFTLKKTDFESDGSEIKLALEANTTQTSQASVKNLSKITVSILVTKLIVNLSYKLLIRFGFVSLLTSLVYTQKA